MSKISFLLNEEPEWLVNRPGARHRIPEPAQSWIYEAGSLTRRLRDLYGDSFNVQLLFHEWRKPLFSEIILLKLPQHQRTLVREVMLSAQDQPLILARTIIPAKTLKGAQRSLSRLGNRPLGEVIFTYPKLQRLEMDFSCMQVSGWSDSLTQKIVITGPVWGRRTVYAIRHREMLVNEFFLPELVGECL